MNPRSCFPLLALLLAASGAGAQSAASPHPFSLSGSYKEGPTDETWSARAARLAASEPVLPARLSDQDRLPGQLLPESTTAWVVGANYSLSGGSLLVGYGRHTPEGHTATRQFSIGYAYPLTRRLYLFADMADKKSALRMRHLDLGLRAAF